MSFIKFSTIKLVLFLGVFDAKIFSNFVGIRKKNILGLMERGLTDLLAIGF